MNRTGLWITLLLVVLCTGLAFGQDVRDVTDQAVPDAVSGPQPALTTGSGNLQKAKFLAEMVVASNADDLVWVNAFNTSVTLTGTGTQCVKLSYTGEMMVYTPTLSTPPPYGALIRAVIDGVAVNGSGKFVMLAINREFSLVGMNWWKCGLAAGTHPVKIQFLPDMQGDIARVGQRTLVIEYAQ